MTPEQRKLERIYKLELGRLQRLNRREDLSAQGEYQFTRQLEITTAAKNRLQECRQREFTLR